MSSNPSIRAVGLGKDYVLGERQPGYRTLREAVTTGLHRRAKSVRPATQQVIRAIDALDFEVAEGESVGFIGHNGAGKTTLLKVLSGITHPSRGYAEVRGRVAALLEVGTGFHPELTGRENVYLNGVILGMRRTEIARRFDEIVQFAGVERFLDTPVKRYSSGMTVRLAFAVAAHLASEVLIVDEVLSVGDAAFQRKCLDRIASLARSGQTVLFVSHNMAVIQGLCDRGIVLERGRMIDDAPIDDAVRTYLNRLEAAATIPLDERSDRRGVGDVRVRSIQVATPEGHVPTTGSAAVIVVTVSEPRPDANLVLSVHDEFGLPVCSFDSRNTSITDTADADPCTFVCEIDQLLLVPGHYSIDIDLRLGKKRHDEVRAAATFDVEQGRSGGRPIIGDVPGAVSLVHRWRTPSV